MYINYVSKNKLKVALISSLMLSIGCTTSSQQTSSVNSNSPQTTEVPASINGPWYTTLDNNLQIEQSFNDKSEEIKPFPDYEFSVHEMNDYGLVIGSLYSYEDLMNSPCLGLGYYDVKTGDSVMIQEGLSSEGGAVKYLTSDESTIFYSETDTNTQLETIYSYNIQTKEKNTIYQTINMGNFNNITMVLTDTDYYISCPIGDGTNENTQNHLLRLNKDTLEAETLCSTMAIYPVLLNDIVYYAEIDNANTRCYLHAYDPKTKEDKTIPIYISGLEYIRKLFSDNGKLYIQINCDEGLTPSVKFYHYDIDNDKYVLHMEMKNHSADQPNVKNNYLTFWSDAALPEKRLNTMYYLFDLNENKFIPYCGGYIKLSNYGMLWERYNVPENTIGTFEEQPGDISFMLYKC